MSLCKKLSPKCVRLIAAICVLAASGFATHAQTSFSPPKDISNSPGVFQQVAVDANGNINIVWTRANGTASGPSDIFFTRSTNGGITFSTPIEISNRPGDSFPVMAVGPNGSIYITWSDTSLGELFSRSTDGGSTFTAPQVVAWNQMAVDAQGNLNVAGVRNSAGLSAVFFSRSTDEGATFSTPVQASNLGNLTGPFNFSTDSSGNIYLVWSAFSTSFPQGQTTDVFFSTSSDGGATFSKATNVSNYSALMGVTSVQVAANSTNNINVVWGAENFVGMNNFTYRHSVDGGASFPTGYDAPFSTVSPTQPQMALDSLGGAHIVWTADNDSSLIGVMYDRMAGGLRAGETAISRTLGSHFAQLLVDSGNNVDIVFGGGLITSSGSPDFDVWFTRSNDVGVTFSPLQNISNFNSAGSNSAGSPWMTVGRDGSVYVAWVQTDILFSRTTAVSITSVALNSTSVAGGSSSTGTVTLNAPAPAGGAVVSLTSSNPAVASVPASVTVPEGSTSATFAVTTTGVSATSNVTISASFSGVTQNASLTVQLVYKFSGYLPPISNDGSSLFHSGRTVPVKFQLTMPDGSIVTNAVATAQVYLIQNTPTGTVDQSMATSPSGGANSGTSFRFDPTSNQYIYNLDTKGYASGVYLLCTTISDGSTHDVQFSIQ